VGLAIRMAIGLGLHKKLDANAPGSQDEQFLDTRRRVFWALYNLDRMVSFNMVRPQGIHDEDIDIEVGCSAQRQEAHTDVTVLQLPSLMSDRSGFDLTSRCVRGLGLQ
jgi:hypothetical protein